MNAGVNNPQEQLQSVLRQALAYQRAGQPVEASQLYLMAIQAQPNVWQAYYNLGTVFQTLGDNAKACSAYRRVIQLHPEFAEAHNNLANTLQALGETDNAEVAYQRAIALKPTLAAASYNLALLLQSKGKFSDSIESLTATVKSDPTNDRAWDALYGAQLAVKRPDDAMATFFAWEAAVQQSPALTAAGLAQARHLADREREAKYLHLAVHWPFSNPQPEEIQPVLGMLQYFDITPDALLQCYRRYDAAAAATRRRPISLLPRRSAGEKIRIGYVSADFRRHVMGRIMAEIIRTHDRNKFEITAVSLCAKRHHDDVTEAYRNTCDRFIDVFPMTTLEAAEAIAEADLDILIDLAALTMAARPLIYAHRPARLIITHLGAHGCIGLSSVDYKVTDVVADPLEMAQFQIEKPLYLDTCLFPFAHLKPNPEADAHYVSLKPAGRFVFAAFVNVLKLSARCLAAWKKIVEREPSVVLAFSPFHDSEIPTIRRVLDAAGIPPDRLLILPTTTVAAENRGRYAAIDAVLDTFPYAGGDTTLAALDRDVPVVTLAGKRNAERVGVSLLTHMGVPELIAETEDQFVEIACRLVREPAFRAATTAKLKHARLHSAIGDPATHTQSLERAYVRLAEVATQETGRLSAADFFREFRSAFVDGQNGETRLAALLDDQPTYVPLLRALAKRAMARGDSSAARRYLSIVLENAPYETESLLGLAGIELASNASASELQAILVRIDALPDKNTLFALKIRARILSALGQFVEVEETIRPASVAAPGDVEAHFILANALANMDRADEALTLYQRVLSLDAKHAPACLNTATLLADRGEWVPAEELLRRAIEIEPDDESAYARLVPILRRENKFFSLAGLGKMMSTRFPHSLRAMLIQAEGQRFNGDLVEESRQCAALAEQLCARNADHAEVEEIAHAILQRVQAIDISPQLVGRLVERYLLALDALYGRRRAATRPGHDAAPRIGVLVSDLDDVTRADAMLRALKSMQRDGQHWIAYALNPAPIAEFGAWVTKIADTARGIMLAGVSVENARKQIDCDDLDVLIDLCGHRHAAAIPIMSARGARLTISNGALATHTTGNRAYLPQDIDFELFDRGTALPAWQARGPERAMMAVSQLLPRSRAAGQVAPRGFPQDAFAFALTAPVTQVSRETLQLARGILDRVPQAVLVVDANDEATLQVWQRIGQGVGIAASKIVPNPSVADAAGRFFGVDAVLDARPGSDAVAVCQALSAAIPVIAMRGPTASERMAYAVLLDAGLTELVAESGPDYINLAVKLARDVAWRASLAEKLLTVAAQPSTSASGVDVLEIALRNLRASNSSVPDIVPK